MEQLTLGAFVAARGRRVDYASDRVLFHEGDESRSVYACVSGRVNLFITTPVGREVILGAKTTGQAFGELSALDGARRSASAVAMEPTSIALLSGDDFLSALTDAPGLALLVLRDLAEHLRIANGRAAARTSENVGERVAHLLVELTEKFRRHGGPINPVALPITQDELAAWVGSTREAVARSLVPMRKCGALETGRNRIVIHDVSSLLTAAVVVGQ